MGEDDVRTGCEGCAMHEDWTYDVIGFLDTCPSACRTCARFYDDMYQTKEGE